MQVKKFEARTMKEALEMVKTQLGPDAVILSARDNKKAFGLVGEGSVEVTAAISETSLRKKAFTESRMPQETRENFQKSQARVQKDVINKFVENQVRKQQVVTSANSGGNRRYIDIIDDDMTPGRGISIDDVRQALAQQSTKDSQPIGATVSAQNYARVAAQAAATQVETEDMTNIKTELSALKNVIQQFQKMPQQMASTFPGSEYGIVHDFSFIYEKLVDEGVDEEYAAELILQTQKKIPATKYKNKGLIEGWVARQILEETIISTGGLESKIHLFFGPTGAGKTSTIIKMASHLLIRERKRVALVTCDTSKVGAPEQMKIYAQILNVPYAVVRSAQEWAQLSRHLSDVDYLLVDYAGSNLKTPEDENNLKRVLPSSILEPWTHLVLPVVSKDAELIELGSRYQPYGFKDVIFTHLDESVHNGTLINFMKKFSCPIFAFGIGSQVPEDFEFATRERVLDLILKITQKPKEVGL